MRLIHLVYVVVLTCVVFLASSFSKTKTLRSASKALRPQVHQQYKRIKQKALKRVNELEQLLSLDELLEEEDLAFESIQSIVSDEQIVQMMHEGVVEEPHVDEEPVEQQAEVVELGEDESNEDFLESQSGEEEEWEEDTQESHEEAVVVMHGSGSEMQFVDFVGEQVKLRPSIKGPKTYRAGEI